MKENSSKIIEMKKFLFSIVIFIGLLGLSSYLIPPTNAQTATVTTINDTASITYSGRFAYLSGRGVGDYQNDVHGARDNGSYFEYTFTGTGIEYITEKNSDEGNVDIYIDGKFQTTVSCANPTRLVQQVVYSKTDLTSGSHTIKVVKKSGNWMLLDALKVYGATFDPTGGVTVIVSAWSDFFSPPPSYGREAQLAPKEWRFRLPFFAKINADGTIEARDDNQETYDKEIQFAGASGIHALAFFFWDSHPLAERIPGRGDMNYQIRQYRRSQYKNLIKFTIIAPLDQIVGATATDLTAKWYSSFIPHVVDMVKDPQYLRLNINGSQRPIIFFYRPERVIKEFAIGAGRASWFENDEALKKAINDLRQAVFAATGQQPYIASASYDQGFLARFGLDAQSGYTANFANELGYNNGALWPYSELTKANIRKWNADLPYVSSVIPTLNTGWDNRPWIDGNPKNAANFAKATPQEIQNHIKSAVSWIKSSNKTPAKAMLIYSWSEYTEGGWLGPTLYEGDARLQEIAKYLKGSTFSSPRFKGRDITGDNAVDIFDYGKLLSDFGKNLDPIPNNADITADGKVDMADHDELMKVLGK